MPANNISIRGGYQPFQIKQDYHLDTFGSAVDKITQQHEKALEQKAAIQSALANVKLNSAEDEWKQKYIDKIVGQLDASAQFGNYSNALSTATQLAGEAVSSPELLGRMRANEKYEEEIKRQKARVDRGDISQNTYSWWLKNNPYSYTDTFDENGNIIGGTEYEPASRPVNDINWASTAMAAFKMLTPDKYSTSKDGSNTVTNHTTKSRQIGGVDYASGEAVSSSWHNASSQEKVSKKDIVARIEELLSSTPDGYRQAEQAYDVASYEFKNMVDEYNKLLAENPYGKETKDLAQKIDARKQLMYRNGSRIDYKEYFARMVTDNLYADGLAYDWKTENSGGTNNYSITEVKQNTGSGRLQSPTYFPGATFNEETGYYEAPMTRQQVDTETSQQEVTTSASNVPRDLRIITSLNNYNMKIEFGDYTYFDGNPDNGTYVGTDGEWSGHYAFDETEFNKLIANRQYEDAANYAANYHFKDPKVQREHENDIINLRRNGRVLGAIYGRIQNPDDLDKITFYDNVFIDGGLERTNSNYSNKFEKIKAMIGSKVDSNGKLQEATNLEVVFEPKTNKLLGVDWLMPDNINTIENFYETSGLTAAKLKEANVDVINKDGRTILKFNKSNPLANKILYNTMTVLTGMGDPNSTYAKVNRKFLKDKPTTIIGYDDKGNYINTTDDLREYKRIIDDAKKTKEKYFENFDLSYKDYSSIAGPLISDELSALREDLNSGNITPTQYNQQARAIAPHVFSAIYSLGSGNYEMYTNKYNDNGGETLMPANNEQRGELVSLINNYDPSDIDISAMVSNGKIGVLVTLKGTGAEEHRYSNDQLRTQIFIPGLLQEEAQAKINRNTSSRAVQELNSMIDWGYDYKFRDGSKLSINERGKFEIGGQEVNKQQAINAINKDMITEEAVANLKFQYINSDGNLINNSKYEQMARLLSMNAIQDIYHDIALDVDPETSKVSIKDRYGNVYNPDDIFDRKIDRNNTQFEIYERFEEIYSMYNKLMNELNYYK